METPKLRWALLGDSLTEWGNWPEWLEREDVANFGISGDTTRGMLHRLPPILRKSPRWLVLMGGINDLLTGVPAERVLENLGQILDKTREQGLEVLLLSVLPTRLGPDINDQVVQINQRLQEWAETDKAWQFLDLYSSLADDDGNLADAYTVDGVHLTPLAYKVWLQAMEAQMQAMEGSTA